MTLSRKSLCLVYAGLSLFALIGTWTNNLQLGTFNPIDANLLFWSDTLATPVSRSITVDILFLAQAVILWMLLEARRLGMRGVWLYIIGGATIAMAVTMPLFMIHRERTLARQAPDAAAGKLATGDVVGYAVLTIVALAYVVLALR
jgi:hypothetical protein